MTAVPPWLIRPLGHDDLPLYRPLRLEALRRHPEAFAASFEEEQDNDQSRMIGDHPSLTLGGFMRDRLVATAGYVVSPRVKQRHRGHVVGVYVAPSCRGSGLAPALLDRLIQQARATGLMVLTLSVTVGNTRRASALSARRIHRLWHRAAWSAHRDTIFRRRTDGLEAARSAVISCHFKVTE